MGADSVLSISGAMGVIGRPVAYHPNIARALCSAKAGIFVCQFLYWEGKQSSEAGWIFKPAHEILAETGLTTTEQQSARKVLKEAGILQEKIAGVPAKLHYLFDWGRLDSVVLDWHTARNAKKKKPAPAPIKTGAAEDPLLYRVHTAFSARHFEIFRYDYSPTRDKNGGKDWNAYRLLAARMRDSLLAYNKRQNPEAPAPVTDDDVARWFLVWLEKMPAKYMAAGRFTPMVLYSDFPEISQLIKDANTKQGTGLADRASQYA